MQNNFRKFEELVFCDLWFPDSGFRFWIPVSGFQVLGLPYPCFYKENNFKPCLTKQLLNMELF